MTSGNSPVPTMAFTPRYRAWLRRDTEEGSREGRLPCPGSRASLWCSSCQSQGPLSYRTSTELSAVIMVTSSGMGSAACIPSLGDFPGSTGHLHLSCCGRHRGYLEMGSLVAPWPRRTCSGQKKSHSWATVRRDALMAERGLPHGFHTLE